MSNGDNQKQYFCHGLQELLELLVAWIREVYSFNLGAESWMELLDTEGLELASSCAGTGLLLRNDCHFDLVIFSRVLSRTVPDCRLDGTLEGVNFEQDKIPRSSGCGCICTLTPRP
jgi:hypothetical protein